MNPKLTETHAKLIWYIAQGKTLKEACALCFPGEIPELVLKRIIELLEKLRG